MRNPEEKLISEIMISTIILEFIFLVLLVIIKK